MKLHPLSAPLRAVTEVRLRTLVVLGAGGFVGGQGSTGVTTSVLTAAAVIAVVFVIRFVWAVLYYQRFVYSLSADTLDISSGVLSRRERNLPIRRIQNVDISQGFLARIVGLAAVSLETAGGGGDAEGELRYVTRDEARRLQNEIQRLKRSGTDSERPSPPNATESEASTNTVSDDGPAEADEVLFSLSLRNLLLASVLSIDLRPLLPVVIVVFEGAQYVPGTVADAVVANPGLGTMIVALGSLGASAAVTFVRDYEFRLWRAGDELRYERGLFSRYTGSIPFEKMQNLIVNENALERRFGYASLAVETAGYGNRSTAMNGAESVVPLAEREAVLRFARSIEGFEFETLDFSRPPKRARRRYAGRYAIAIGAVTAALFAAHIEIGVPILEWWFVPLVFSLGVPLAAHYKWLQRGVRLDEEHVLTRNGFWRRTIEIVPYYRVQTVIQKQTVFQRRWRLATVVIDTAGSRNLRHQGARAVDVDATNAPGIRGTVRQRLHWGVVERRRSRREAVGRSARNSRSRNGS